MKKKNNFFIVVILSLFFFSNISAEEKIAFVDINYVYSNSQIGKKIINEIKVKKENLDKDFKYPGDGFSILAYADSTVKVKGFDISLRARVFCPLMGIEEDPATGSACAALAGFLLSIAESTRNKISVAITQGVEIGRRSQIYATAMKDSNQKITVKIGGSCVEVIDGVLEI